MKQTHLKNKANPDVRAQLEAKYESQYRVGDDGGDVKLTLGCPSAHNRTKFRRKSNLPKSQMAKELKNIRGDERRRSWTATSMRDVIRCVIDKGLLCASGEYNVPAGNLSRWHSRLSHFRVFILKCPTVYSVLRCFLVSFYSSTKCVELVF